MDHVHAAPPALERLPTTPAGSRHANGGRRNSGVRSSDSSAEPGTTNQVVARRSPSLSSTTTSASSSGTSVLRQRRRAERLDSEVFFDVSLSAPPARSSSARKDGGEAVLSSGGRNMREEVTDADLAGVPAIDDGLEDPVVREVYETRHLNDEMNRAAETLADRSLPLALLYASCGLCVVSRARHYVLWILQWVLRTFIFLTLIAYVFVPGRGTFTTKRLQGIKTSWDEEATSLSPGDALALLPLIYVCFYVGLVKLYGLEGPRKNGLLIERLNYVVACQWLGASDVDDDRTAVSARIDGWLRNTAIVLLVVAGGTLGYVIPLAIVRISEGGDVHVIVISALATYFAQTSILAGLSQIIIGQYGHFYTLSQFAGMVGPLSSRTRFEREKKIVRFDPAFHLGVIVPRLRRLVADLADLSHTVWWAVSGATLVLLIFTLLALINAVTRRELGDFVNVALFSLPLGLMLLVPAWLSTVVQAYNLRARTLVFRFSDATDYHAFLELIRVSATGYSVLGMIIDVALLTRLATALSSVISIGLAQAGGSG
jgi:hypothetical protein